MTHSKDDVAAELQSKDAPAGTQPVAVGGVGFAEALKKKMAKPRKVKRDQKVLRKDGTVVDIKTRSIDPESESKYSD